MSSRREDALQGNKSPVAYPVLNSTMSSKGEIGGGNKSNLQKRRKYKFLKIRPVDEKGCNKPKRIGLP